MTYSRMYVLVNKDLDMSTGKIAAQVAHATVRLAVKEVPRTVVVLEATGEQIKNLERYLDREKVGCFLYIDEGANEIPPFSVTTLAVAPIDDDDMELRELFQGFNLLKKTVKCFWHGEQKV